MNNMANNGAYSNHTTSVVEVSATYAIIDETIDIFTLHCRNKCLWGAGKKINSLNMIVSLEIK